MSADVRRCRCKPGALGRDLAHLARARRHRLVLEHDDIRFSAADVLWIQGRTGVRLVFDYQHFWCLNPERLDMVETIRPILASWPAGVGRRCTIRHRARSCARSSDGTRRRSV